MNDLVLTPKGISLFARPSDWPKWRVFLPFIECGFSDDEAWEALFDDEKRLDDARVVYGKRLYVPSRRRAA